MKAGIHHLLMDEQTGSLQLVAGMTGIENPSYIHWDPSVQRLYAVQETSADPSVFEVGFDEAGRLTPLQARPTSGAAPCFVVSTHHQGRDGLLVVNYGGGSVDWFALDDRGQIQSRQHRVVHEGRGPHPARQTAPHPHSASWDPTGRTLWVPDLGLDAVMVYRDGGAHAPLAFVTKVSGHPQSGPRFLVFHPRAPYWYLANELDSTVSVWRYQLEPMPSAEPLQVLSTLPDGVSGEHNTVAHIALHPRLHRLYVSNRGYHSIAVYQLASDASRLDRIAVVQTVAQIPRHFTLTPDGRWMIVAGQDANCLEVMAIGEDGIPVPQGRTLALERPTCVVVRSGERG
jgi:6-phosphogluconolactonase